MPPAAALTGPHRCILTLSVPVELCDTAAIATAVFSLILSRNISETALVTTVTRLPSLPFSPRTWALGPHVTTLQMSEKAIAASPRRIRSRLISARSAARPTIS